MDEVLSMYKPSFTEICWHNNRENSEQQIYKGCVFMTLTFTLRPWIKLSHCYVRPTSQVLERSSDQ